MGIYMCMYILVLLLFKFVKDNFILFDSAMFYST